MEEVYQKYKDRVNFLWTYSREAHPEERPFALGFETKDLGWDYRYFETTTMEQRAQRSRWIKTDLEPDAEIPIIIDYINSPLGTDNAIYNAYTGGGFYAGFVIDCDATIIYQENWAWFAPGGQWWGLPLDPVANLEDFLDSYLANPPLCYEQPSATDVPQTPSFTESPSGETEGLPTVLIVDDDGGSAYEGYLKIPLGKLKKHYQVWDVQENGSPSSNIMKNYEVVVWFTGNTSQGTLTSADQENLSAYLDAGGKLLLSGQNIGHDIGDTAFYHDYLHATLIDEGMAINRLVGDDILTGIEVTISGMDGAGNQVSPSRIGLLGRAVAVFRYDTLGLPAWGGMRWEGDYQVVYFAFGLEGIGDRGAAVFRFQILKKVFDWFEDSEPATTTTTIQSTTTTTESTTTASGAHNGKVDDTLCLTCHDVSFSDGGLHGIHIDNDCTACHEIVGDTPAAFQCTLCHPLGDPGKCELALYHEDSMDYDPSDLSCLDCHVGCTGKTPLCSVLSIYGEDSAEAELLRNMRDTVLRQTQEGKELIRLYYRWSPAIVKAMEQDEEFKDEVKGIIDEIVTSIDMTED
jgi:hypothetical protein